MAGGRDHFRRWLVGQLKSNSLVVLLLLFAAFVVRETLSRLPKDQLALVGALICINVVLAVLLPACLVYIIKLLLDELRRKAQEHERLEELVMKNRKSTKKERE